MVASLAAVTTRSNGLYDVTALVDGEVVTIAHEVPDVLDAGVYARSWDQHHADQPAPQDPAKHLVRWWVWEIDHTVPDRRWKQLRNAKMVGRIAFDVTCSCGWESSTGGATRGYVEQQVWAHRFDASVATVAK